MASANTRYASRLLLLSLLSAGLSLGGSVLRRVVTVPKELVPLVALAPVVPLVALFFGFSRWIRAMDELERLVHLEAMAVQFGATGLVVMGYGALARFGAVPDLRASQVYPFLWLAIFLFWAVGVALVRRKYR